MKVLYSCSGCRALERPVEVPAREGAGADLGAWMKQVMMCVGADHEQRGCGSRACDLKIPMPKDADYLGQEIKQ